MQKVTAHEANQIEVLTLGDLSAAYGGQSLAMEVLRSGGTAAQFMTRMLSRVREMPMRAGADALLGLDSAETRGYSITAAVRAMAEGDWKQAGLERNLSDLVTTRTSAVPNGLFVPLGLLARDFNAGTASQAGNLLGAAVDGGRAADPMRNVSVLAGLGATLVSGLRETTTIPRFTSSSSAAWKSEVAAATEVLEQTAGVVLTPKRAAVTIILSRQALLQATPQLDVTVSRQLVACLMDLLENSAVNGDGTNDAPVGIRNTSGVGVVAGGLNGAAPTYDHFVDLENAIDIGNAAITENAGFLVNGKTRKILRRTVKGVWSGNEIWTGGDRPLLGYRAAVSNIMPSNLEKGSSGAVCSSAVFSADWSNLVIGVYGGGVDLTVDRVTLAAEGLVRITAALQVGVGVVRPAAFAKIDDLITA